MDLNKQKEIIFYKKLKNLIKISYFRPLLMIIALANLGKYRKTKLHKKFKIFISNQDNVAKLVLSDKTTVGSNSNNSIYLSKRQTIISYIHEVIHVVCQQVYDNYNYPSPPGEEKRFQNILTLVQNKLSKTNEIKLNNYHEREAVYSLKIGLDS